MERILPATVAGDGKTAEVRLRIAWALDGVAGETNEELPDLVAEVNGALRPHTEPQKPVDHGRWVLPRLAVPQGAAVDAVAQVGKGLGDRLFTALSAASEAHSGGVAAVGSDHPTLPLERVRAAFAALGRADVVLGPADDGGYYLIALRPEAVRRRLFADVPWSTDGVLAATEARCRELGLRVEHLPEGRDVDEPADLERLAALLANGEVGPDGGAGEAVDCPRTRALLATWGLLPEQTS